MVSSDLRTLSAGCLAVGRRGGGLLGLAACCSVLGLQSDLHSHHSLCIVQLEPELRSRHTWEWRAQRPGSGARVRALWAPSRSERSG